MSNETKACNLTEDEIKSLIITHAREMAEDTIEEALERISYLYKRLKAFKEEAPKTAEVIQQPEPAAKTGWA